ncbi:MFS transporter [Amycolatopsis sp. NPDC059657]|uniref:MFS transporter n=1 Tax=Amycolatopsis sp. NPDC059657 TaxID=3346899 RepID=UPI003671D9E1
MAGEGKRLWARGEFRVLFTATLVSIVGDQFARVGLSVLVFERTRSAGLTALTYALTYLPDVVAGPLLSGLADRWPRRTVMIAADLLRAVGVAAMAAPGMPLAVVAALLVGVQCAGAPGNAARAATATAVLPEPDVYLRGKAALDIVVQLAQVAGFAAGGVLTGWLGASDALLADAGTFVLSAALVTAGIRRRPSPAEPTDAGGMRRWWAEVSGGARLVARTPRLRALLGLACVAGFYVTVEGLAAPYAAQAGAGAVGVGLLLAASPAGAVVGMAVVARLPASWREKVMGPLAVSACVPLLACVVGPPLPVTVTLWAVSGMASSYHLLASAAYLQAVPDQRRGQAYGIAATALRTSQGLGIALAGLVAEHAQANVVVAAAGGVGVVAAVGASVAWNHARRTTTVTSPVPDGGAV